jgi:hypothetical protein
VKLFFHVVCLWIYDIFSILDCRPIEWF